MGSLLERVAALRAHPKVDLGRRAAITLMLGAALYLFGKQVHEHYPIQHWLFWSYAKLWGWCLLFGAACFSAGTLVVSWLLPKGFPLRERLVFTLPAGVLMFFYALFLGGLCHLFSPVFAVVMPIGLVAAGALPTYRSLRPFFRHLRAARRRGVAPLVWWHYPAGLLGLLGVGALYFAILSPDNIAFDSHFYHLGIAQQYAADKAILRSPEAWWTLAIPHLASVLYTWSFLLPGLNGFERIVGAAHLEFVIFLWTLLAIPTLVRWLAPGARGRMTWVAMFLFPGILLYDSHLSAAADHITAFWAIPIYLAFRRAYRDLEPRYTALVALLLGGAFLTKYQAFYLILPVLVLIGRTVWLMARGALRKRKGDPTVRLSAPLVGLATAAGVGLAITGAHWLKNWVFYGDPLFPYLAGVLHPRGHVPEVDRLYREWQQWQFTPWVFPGTTQERLLEGLKVMGTFSFKPHDFPRFHGKVPIFGSLFTLSLLLLPFLERTKRIWPLVIATQLGVFLWFWTFPFDRYLQILLPWMAAATAATFSLAWRTDVVARAAVVVLIAAQVIWGGDVYFIPAHAMTKQSPAITTSKLLGEGYKKRYEERYELGQLHKIGAVLPKDATVLLHEHNPRLGLWRRVVSDGAGWQFGIRYELLGGPREVHELFQRFGVTHILTRRQTSRMWDAIGADLQFFEYVERWAKPGKKMGTFSIFEPAKEPPPATGTRYAAYLGCGRFYQPGLYEVKDLFVREAGKTDFERISAPKPVPRDRKQLPAWLDEATFLITGDGCRYNAPKDQLKRFTLLAKRKREKLYIRNAPQ